MRANDLSASILELKAIVAAAGANTAEADLAKLAEFIGSYGDEDADRVLEEIKSLLDPAALKARAIERRAKALLDAQFDEHAFRSEINAIREDKYLNKDDVLAILNKYGVIRISGKSRATYLESLEKHFYWKLYNKDADEMAKRATPW